MFSKIYLNILMLKHHCHLSSWNSINLETVLLSQVVKKNILLCITECHEVFKIRHTLGSANSRSAPIDPVSSSYGRKNQLAARLDGGDDRLIV